MATSIPVKSNTTQSTNKIKEEQSSEVSVASKEDSSFKKLIVKLPTKIGSQTVTSPEQLARLLQSQSNRQVLQNGDGAAQKSNSASKTTEGEEYKCTQCEYTSHNKHYLKQHVELVHLAERPFKCPFCDYAGKRSHSLKEHLVVHSSYRPFECHFCNASFRKKGHLTNHIKLHASLNQTEQEYICKVCAEVFMQASELWIHLRKDHKTSTLELYLCQDCPFATVDQAEYSAHVCSVTKGKLHSCTACDFVCDREMDMMNHIAGIHKGKASCTVHMAQSKPSTVPVRGGTVVLLKCTECGFTSRDKDVLREHMFVHLSEEDRRQILERSEGKNADKQATKAYECECGHLAPSEELMLEHVRLDHIGEGRGDTSTVLMLKCAECGYTASDKDTMSKHMVEHLDQAGVKTVSEVQVTPTSTAASSTTAMTLYNCAQCNFSSKEAYVFITHMLTHRPAVRGPARPASSPRGGNSPTPQGAAQPETKAPSTQGYVHDMAMGVYRCAICSYTCEHQRTIKAHIWKHSGHKDIDYPMFQNGPLSMFDYTPIGATKLASNKSVIAEPRQVKTPPQLTTKEQTIAVDSESVKHKTIVSAKTILDGNSKQVILVPASTQQERTVLLQMNEQASSVAKTDIQPQVTASNMALKGLLGSRKEVMLAPQQLIPAEHEVVPVGAEFERKKRQQQEIEEEEENQMPPLKKAVIEVMPASPAHVVVEPMYPRELQLEIVAPPSVNNSPQPKPLEVMEEAASPENETGEAAPQYVTMETDAMDLQVEEVECTYVEEANCVEVYTSQEDSGSGSISEVQVEDEEEGGQNLEDPEDITREQALTLLSLLKKGPNFNPACPPVDKAGPTVDCHNKARILDHSYRGRKADMKPGISDSLLAAIEHLRQGEESEGEADSGVSTTGKRTRGRPAKGTRKRGRRKAAQALRGSPIDGNLNVEKLARDRLRCKLCHYTTTSAVLMGCHMRVHKAKTSTECTLCDFVSEDSKQLQQHILQHCKVRTYQCKYCSSEFSYKSQLRAHMRAHDDRHPLLCESCDFQTWDLLAYQRHLPCQALQTMCGSCGTRFTTPAELDNHIASTKCNPEGDLQCDQCTYSTDSPEEFNNHVRMHCRTKPNPEGALQCDQCLYSTDNQDQYNKHLRWHSRTYKCDQCDFVCTNYKGMANHSRVHFEEREQKCEYCDFVAKSVRSLKSHMKRHANDQRFVQQPLEQYMCNLCGYVCHHLPSLKSHMWRHASDTNYSYTVTNQVINAALDWDSNKEDGDSQGEAPPTATETPETSQVSPGKSLITFCCCQCGFESTDKGLLNSHMKIHNDIIQKTLAVNMGRFAIQNAPDDNMDDSEATEKTAKE